MATRANPTQAAGSEATTRQRKATKKFKVSPVPSGRKQAQIPGATANSDVPNDTVPVRRAKGQKQLV